MAKTATTTRETYPPALREVSGSKVSWRHYATFDEAVAAARIALREAERLESLGYEYGYQSPGHIEEHDGEFIVCVP